MNRYDFVLIFGSVVIYRNVININLKEFFKDFEFLKNVFNKKFFLILIFKLG